MGSDGMGSDGMGSDGMRDLTRAWLPWRHRPALPSVSGGGGSLPLIDWSELPLEGEIGAGQTGRVFLTRYRGVPVAVRRFDAAVSHLSSAAELRRELEAVSAVARHEHLLQRVGFAASRGMRAVGEVMQLAPYSLATLLSESADVPLSGADPEACSRIAQQVGEALACLHSLGVVHGCLWPPNVLLGGPTQREVKLADYARSATLISFLFEMEEYGDADADISPDSRRAFFVAPEVLAGGDASAAADMYAVGCLIARMGMQQPLYARQLSSTPTPKVLYQVMAGSLSPLDDMRASAHFGSSPPRMVEIAEECLSARASDRPEAQTLSPRLRTPTDVRAPSCRDPSYIEPGVLPPPRTSGQLRESYIEPRVLPPPSLLASRRESYIEPQRLPPPCAQQGGNSRRASSQPLIGLPAAALAPGPGPGPGPAPGPAPAPAPAPPAPASCDRTWQWV